jgi:hypothetical protein
MENYPAIAILVRYGKVLAAGVALVPVLAALCAVVTLGVHWGWVAAGVAAGALVGLLFKALVELTVIITDMLLPK